LEWRKSYHFNKFPHAPKFITIKIGKFPWNIWHWGKYGCEGILAMLLLEKVYFFSCMMHITNRYGRKIKIIRQKKAIFD
jgi:hypothetical protein